MDIYIPLLVCIIGAFAYLIAGRNPKGTAAAELGRIMFMMGLLVTLATWANHSTHL